MEEAALSESCGPLFLFLYGWWLLDLDAAEVAVAFEVEGLGTVAVLGAAVAVDTGEGGVDVVHNTDALIDSDFHAAEAAVDGDDGAVA